MKLFTVGPVQMRNEIKAVGGLQVPYFRTKEFSNMMLDSDRLLRKFMHAGNDAKTIYLTASGTGAMEATVMNCLCDKDKVLVINGGTFGKRFADICEIHGVPHIEVELQSNEELTKEHLAKFDKIGITALLVNINETSTGQLYNVKILSEFCKRNNAFFIVDGISSFLIDKYDMLRDGIDATIISSQKGLCIAPGLSAVVLSNRLLREKVEKQNVKMLYFDFKEYITNFQRGQTPFTPCVGICVQMNKVLHMIDDVGLNKWLETIDIVAKDFRKKIEGLPITIPRFPMGNAVTPIIFERGIAKEVFLVLKKKYNIYVNPTGGEKENYVLRIAHIGDITIEDNTILVKALTDAIREVG